jgi:hypothetical protein
MQVTAGVEAKLMGSFLSIQERNKQFSNEDI